VSTANAPPMLLTFTRLKNELYQLKQLIICPSIILIISIQTNQYSVTEHLRHVNPGAGRGLPGVFFFYEISPLHVEIVEDYRKGYLGFFTSFCAIVGGVVTTFGLLDQVLNSQNQRSHDRAQGLVQ
tara:strand:+ start:62 stop:439 length:378 start_codon:yes stop_codon:yes gene_type:complete